MLRCVSTIWGFVVGSLIQIPQHWIMGGEGMVGGHKGVKAAFSLWVSLEPFDHTPKTNTVCVSVCTPMHVWALACRFELWCLLKIIKLSLENTYLAIRAALRSHFTCGLGVLRGCIQKWNTKKEKKKGQIKHWVHIGPRAVKALATILEHLRIYIYR